jgi:hypothetical protein
MIQINRSVLLIELCNLGRRRSDLGVDLVMLAGDDLKWINPGSSGGGSTENVWKRAKQV